MFVTGDLAYVADHFSVLVLQPTFPVDVAEEEITPASYVLGQNYPNPFNPMTTIEYSLAQRSHVRLDILNILGQRVRTLVDREESSGTHRIEWDGKSDDGRSVSTGVYLYRIQTDEFTRTRKMLLLK